MVCPPKIKTADVHVKNVAKIFHKGMSVLLLLHCFVALISFVSVALCVKETGCAESLCSQTLTFVGGF